jgi:hypothetical protein
MPQSKLGMRQSLAHYIRDNTRQGEELVDLVLEVMRGEFKGKKNSKVQANPTLRMAAVDWLADRGWGRPQQHIEIDVGENATRAALQEYTIEQLARLVDSLPEEGSLCLPPMLTSQMEDVGGQADQ